MVRTKAVVQHDKLEKTPELVPVVDTPSGDETLRKLTRAAPLIRPAGKVIGASGIDAAPSKLPSRRAGTKL